MSSAALRGYVLAAGLAVVWAAAPQPTGAHADIDERIAALNARIEADPHNADLYLKRGELHRLHRDWESAIADYQRAVSLDHSLSEVDYCLGRMWLEADRPDRARPLLDRYLARRPGDANALLVRARTLARLGKRLAAVDDLTKVIASVKTPSPELFLERSRLLVAEGGDHVELGLAGMDDGVARLGPLVTLVKFAVDVEAERGDYDAALRRLDMLPRVVKNDPSWLAHRGDLLLAAGRDSQARRAYAAALEAIRARSAGSRGKTADLERRLRSFLGMHSTSE